MPVPTQEHKNTIFC